MGVNLELDENLVPCLTKMEASCYPLFWVLRAMGLHPVALRSGSTYHVIYSRFLINFFIILISAASYFASLIAKQPNYYLKAVIDGFYFINFFNIAALHMLIFLKRESLCKLVTLLASSGHRTPRKYYVMGPLIVAAYSSVVIVTMYYTYQRGALHLWGISLCSINQCYLTMWNVQFCFYLNAVQDSYAATLARLPEVTCADDGDLGSYVDLISRLRQLTEQFNEVCGASGGYSQRRLMEDEAD